jgi:hypothetical protein
MVLPTRDAIEEGLEEGGLPAAVLEQHLQDHVVVAERARGEDAEEVVRGVLPWPQLERQVVMLQDWDGPRVEALRDESLREALDRISSRETRPDRLEVRKHRFKLEGTLSA